MTISSTIRKVNIDTSIDGTRAACREGARVADERPAGRSRRASSRSESKCPCKLSASARAQLAPIYRETLDLRAKVAASDLDARGKGRVLFELDAKIEQFQAALKDLLGLDLIAFRTNETDCADWRIPVAARPMRRRAAFLPGEDSRCACIRRRAANRTRGSKGVAREQQRRSRGRGRWRAAQRAGNGQVCRTDLSA